MKIFTLIRRGTHNNEEDIKKCEIKINDKLIPFNYKYKFNSQGKYKIKYSFNVNNSYIIHPNEYISILLSHIISSYFSCL